MAIAHKHELIADGAVRGVGGAGNVRSVVCCMTRVRFVVHDRAKVDRAAIERVDGVIKVVEAGGQVQVVIGNDAQQVFEAVERLTGAGSKGGGAPASTGAKGLLSRFIDLISSIFQPIIWVLAGVGLLKGLLSLATTLSWTSAESQTYTILYAASDAMFYFLPLFLAVTAARRFKANPYIALAIAGALVHPSIIALQGAEDGVRFLGIPVVMVSYVSSVIPIILTVWGLSHLERFLHRVLHPSIRNFLTPLIAIALLVPLTLLTIGPVTTLLSNAISDGVKALWELSPTVAGGLLGGTAQVLVIFGLHWGFIAMMVNDIANLGYTLIMGPWPAAAMAQVGAVIAVFLKTRSRKLKQVAGPAAVSGLAAGITEPILYGVNLPLKRPFFFALAAGAVGGAVASSGGSASEGMAVPGLLTLPVFLNHGNFALQVIGTVGAMVLAFVLTLVFGFKDPRDEERVATGAVAPLDIATPVAGTVIPLSEVPDAVFASEALGRSAAIRPSDGTVVSPVAGVVVSALPHAFGLRTADGVEVLVHVGIDTVQLEGRHFVAGVAQGANVAVGDLLTTVDLAGVAAAGYDTTTVVVLTNSAGLAAVDAVATGEVRHPDVVLRAHTHEPATAS